jgi:Uma2 family endonuclease
MALPTIQTSTPARSWPEQGQWTYDDWLRLPDDAYRYEIIEGELFVSPPPSIQNQIAVSSLLAARHRHAKENDLGLVLTAPIGVRLPGKEATVQPDLLFIRRERLRLVKDDVVDGAPDLVVEVLSPSNWVYDRSRKQRAYEQAGVREYWIVDYRARTVDVLVLEGSEYVQRGQYVEGSSAPSEALPGFAMPVADIFAR